MGDELKFFCDFHHSALAESLVMLLENRLGYEVYFPTGLDWFPEFWKIGDPYPNPLDTAKQFLAREIPSDGTGEVKVHRGITLEEFKQTKFDVMIASYDKHVDPYLKLIELYQPQAKLVQQLGNAWSPHERVKNVLASIEPFPTDKHVCFYHQEFDQNTYKPVVKEKRKKIVSFVNCLGSQDLFEKDWDDFRALEGLLPELEFKSYGASCRDGFVTGHANIANTMNLARFAIHFKNGGDGYGHVIHQWFSCGTPVIYKSSQYKGKLAGHLLKDGVTGWDFDKHGLGVSELIKNQTPAQYYAMRQNVIYTIGEFVHFDRDAEFVSAFLSSLI